MIQRHTRAVSDAHVASPGVTVPPPAIYALGFVLGLGVESLEPTPNPPLRAGVAVAVAGVAAWALLDPWAMRQFKAAGTEVSPSRSATALVTTGPYRWTRNPMYVGMALLYAALAVALGVLWALVTLMAVLVVIDRVVVPREERHLKAAIGDAYARYQAEVRRWI